MKIKLLNGIIQRMSYLTDLYKFTREIKKQTQKGQELPKVREFNVHFANKFLDGNKRYTDEISKTAQSDKYDLIKIDHEYYNLTLRGYNIVKGIPFFRPGFIFLVLNELKNGLTLFIALAALIVSILVAIYK